MKYKSLLILILLLVVIAAQNANAQQSPTSAGGDAIGSGGSVAYSVGQMVYTTNNGVNGSVAQGVQQPYEISINAINDFNGVDLKMMVYPNPTPDVLYLTIDQEKLNAFSYELVDVQGKKLALKPIVNKQTAINMEPFAAATYVLQVLLENQIIKSFKIIKN